MNVCMLAHSIMPEDIRIRKEALALVEKGVQVDIICLSEPKKARYEIYKDINIYRIPVIKKRGGYLTFILNYLSTTFFCFLMLITLFPKKRYRFIHIHNPPDSLIFAALPFKIFGTKIILDIHQKIY